MANLNLNLLPSRAKFQVKKIRLSKLVKKYMIVFLSVWVMVAAGVLLFGFGVNLLASREKTRLNSVEAEVKSLSQRALTGWKLKYTAGMVVKALSSRFEYGKTFDLINNLISGDIGVRDMELRDNRTFYVRGETQQRGTIDLLEEKINTVNRGEVDGLDRAELTSLQYSRGRWSYSLEIGLK